MRGVDFSRRAKEIFESALELEANCRDELLREACGNDQELRQRVETLLARSDTAGSFLETPALGTPWMGRRIGCYELIEQIGQGGMSLVFLAERRQEDFPHRVAIKLMRRGLDSEDLLDRFHQERRILAALQHPQIARLLDGGTTGDGVPYLVMEHIDGLPITEFCDRHRLTVRQRLELLRKVCEAVTFAHQSLVVHRDLKPSNILVTAEGRPKLLDFGTAKLLEVADDADITATRHRVLTLNYASPEQLTGARIATATDVYSLGLLLFELLAGRLPVDRSALPLSRLEEAFERGAALRPSEIVAEAATAAEVAAKRNTSTESLRRLLAGDLDSIAAGALQREPAERYTSVERFSLDLQRHMEGMPVSVRRPTPLYRFGKFLRRNRLSSLAAAALLLCAAAALVQSFRIAEQRDAAEQERAKAEVVTRFLLDSFRFADPPIERREGLTARDLLDEAAARAADELADQPEVQASLLHTLGLGYRHLGLLPEAHRHLEAAVAQRRRWRQQRPLELADSLHALADVDSMKGRYESGQRLAREALRIRRRELGPDHFESATTRVLLALSLLHLGRLEEAQSEAQGAEASLRRRPGPEERLAQALNALALIQIERGEYAAAEPKANEALELLRRIFGAEHPTTADSLNTLAITLYHLGDYRRAEQHYREALAQRVHRLGDEHPEVALVQNNLAVVLMHQGRYQEAEELYRTALDVRRRRLGDRHPLVSESLHNLASLEWNRGRLGDAEALFRQSLELDADRESSTPSPGTLSSLGIVLSQQGEYRTAETFLRRAVQIWQRQDPEHPKLASALVNLGSLLTELGNFEESETLLRRAVAIYARTRDGEHPEAAAGLNALAYLLATRGRYSEAEALFEQSGALVERLLGESHPWAVISRSNLGDVHRHLARLDDAEANLRRAAEEAGSLLGPQHAEVPSIYQRLAAVRRRQGAGEEAEALLRRSIEQRREQCGDGHPRLLPALLELADLLASEGRRAEARPLLAEADGIVRSKLPSGHWRAAVVASIRGSLLAAANDPLAGDMLDAAYQELVRRLGEEATEAGEAGERLARWHGRSAGGRT